MKMLLLAFFLPVSAHSQALTELNAQARTLNADLLLPAVSTPKALAWMSPVYAKADGAQLSEGQLAARLLDTRLIYVGEQHNQPFSHLVEAEVVREMARVHPDLAVGLEMADRSQQK